MADKLIYHGHHLARFSCRTTPSTNARIYHDQRNATQPNQHTDGPDPRPCLALPARASIMVLWIWWMALSWIRRWRHHVQVRVALLDWASAVYVWLRHIYSVEMISEAVSDGVLIYYNVRTDTLQRHCVQWSHLKKLLSLLRVAFCVSASKCQLRFFTFG